jgi:hypothetical protein
MDQPFDVRRQDIYEVRRFGKMIEELGRMQREVMIRTSGKCGPLYIHRSLCPSSC